MEISKNIKKDVLDFIQKLDRDNTIDTSAIFVSVSEKCIILEFKYFMYITVAHYKDGFDYSIRLNGKTDINKFDFYINVLSFVKQHHISLEMKLKSYFI